MFWSLWKAELAGKGNILKFNVKNLKSKVIKYNIREGSEKVSVSF